jgi:hypothetical protein
VGAENLCHQAIFVNHAPGAIAPPDTEVVQVGDAIRQRAERRGLVQGAVQPVLWGSSQCGLALFRVSAGHRLIL